MGQGGKETKKMIRGKAGPREEEKGEVGRERKELRPKPLSNADFYSIIKDNKEKRVWKITNMPFNS